MKDFFKPLSIFVMGMLLVIAFFLIGNAALKPAVVDLSGNTTAIAASYWGWSWLMTPGVVIALCFVLIILVVMWNVGKAYLKRRMYG